MAVTFDVDDVTLEGEAYSWVSTEQTLKARLGNDVLASGGPIEVIECEKLHPLVGAVHRAFAQHRPLVLSPDVMWTTIAQGFALHVKLHAEALRERFVRHAGKQALLVMRGLEPIDAGEWPGLIEGFALQIREYVGPGLHRLLVNDFSTSGPLERTASEVGMMETFSPYFDFVVMCVCGIPTVTLTGTPEDWRAIRGRLDVLAEYGLADWIEKLAPVADQWVKSAEGQPDRDFWQHMYKPREAYGGDVVTGWLVRLFPYLIGNGEPCRNEALYREWADLGPIHNWLFGRDDVPPQSAWVHDGVGLDAFGLGLSVASVTIEYVDGRLPPRKVQVFGGLVGVTQEAGTLALEPKLGWCVCNDREGTAIEQLAERSGELLPDGGDSNPRTDASPGV